MIVRLIDFHITYDKDDGLYYINISYSSFDKDAHVLNKSIALDGRFFENEYSYISPIDVVKTHLPDLSEEVLFQIINKIEAQTYYIK